MFEVGVRLLVAISFAVVSSACGSDDGGSRAATLSRHELTWVDTSRNLPRTPEREIRVLIWDPGGAGVLPLLLLAHGFGGLPEKFDAFARSVAAAGYVAAAPAFPLTNENAPGGHERGLFDTVNQPGDITFSLDRLLEANGDASHPLFARIDPGRIALLGHSLGGLTALATTRKDCCLEPRIGAVILVAAVPDFGNQFGTDSIAEGPPTLLIHGQADPVIPFQTSIDLYGQLQPPKILIGLENVGHSEAVESQTMPAEPARKAAEAATLAFLRASFDNDTNALLATLDELAEAGQQVDHAL